MVAPASRTAARSPVRGPTVDHVDSFRPIRLRDVATVDDIDSSVRTERFVDNPVDWADARDSNVALVAKTVDAIDTHSAADRRNVWGDQDGTP